MYFFSNFILSFVWAALYLVLQGFSLGLFAQTCLVTGQIRGEDGEPLPFASVREFKQNKGTLADADGKFKIELNIGEAELEFRFVGHEAQKVKLTCPNPQPILIKLQEQLYTLEETYVTSDGKDPAYGIMRKAIDNRKYHLGKPNAFRCMVYIKGIQRLHAFPDRVLGMRVSLDSSDLGIVYLSESVSKFNLRKPKDIREVMVSSKVSGRNNAFSYNQASDILIDFYESLINVYELSERGFISPLSASSFLYYRFKLLGKFLDAGETVYRIEVIPKRNTDPVFAGEIFIAAPSYRIHSTNLYLTKSTGVEFVDTLRIEQLFVPIQDSLWMPASQKLDFAFSAMGFKGNGNFVTNFMDYEVNPEFPKSFFSKEILKVEEGANKRTEAYWDSIRPTPLTQEEISDYFKKDSLATLKEQPEYLDSLDRARNKLDPFRYLVSGHSWVRRKRKLTYSISALLEGIQFNTVEGFVVFNNLSVLKRLENNRFLESNTGLRYGFASGRPYFQEEINWRLHAPTQTILSLKGGRWIHQFDPGNPVPSLPNTLYTLLDETNFIKLYEKQFAQVGFRRELLNGLEVNILSEYGRRLALVNHTDYTLREVQDRVYSSNNPLDAQDRTVAFESHLSWTVEMNAKIVFGNEYTTRPDRKINNGSKWPFVDLQFRAGLPFAGAATQFMDVSGYLQDEWNFRMLGKSIWKIGGGYFPDNSRMFFMDYRHFTGNRLILRRSGDLQFQGLPYYDYSTDQHYGTLHYIHHFGGWFINKIPVLRKLKLGEYFGTNMLWVSGQARYTEFIFGLEKFGVELGGVVAYKGGVLNYGGVRLGSRF
jgi:hypothetical protein